MNFGFALTCFLVLVQVHLSGQSALQKATDAIIANPLSKGATMAFSARKVSDNTSLFGWNADQWMIPASNQKLITTAAALALLGPDHRIPTIIRAEGMLIDSLFLGRLIIEGHGDPSLASGRTGRTYSEDALIQRWVQGLRQQGIREIQGEIVVLPRDYPGSPVGLTWEWGDLGGCFAPGVWPLNWDENCVRTQLNRDTAGLHFTMDSTRLPWPVVASWEPRRQRGEPDFITGAPQSTTRWVSGPANVTLPIAVRAAVPDVPDFVKARIPVLIRQAGIPFRVVPITYSHTQSIWRDTVWSAPLLQLISLINTESHNLYAEAILRRLGEVQGTVPSVGQGIWAIKKWLDSIAVTPRPYIHDACGLSRQNALTAGFLTQLLGHYAQDSTRREMFLQTLAIGGQTGTLSGHFRDKRLKGRVFGKTGTLTRVRTVSGYLKRQDGEWIAFSILANQFTGTTPEFMALAQQWLISLALTTE